MPPKGIDPTAESEAFNAGLAVRRAVVGEDYVANSLANADELSIPLQKLVTEGAWGMVWTREELGRRERSIATVAMLAALGREEELRLHLGGARRNGLTAIELREIILQVCIYAGFPAGLAAFRVLRDVLARESTGES